MYVLYFCHCVKITHDELLLRMYASSSHSSTLASLKCFLLMQYFPKHRRVKVWCHAPYLSDK